jgi:hypothetical protein
MTRDMNTSRKAAGHVEVFAHGAPKSRGITKRVRYEGY